MEVQYGMVCHDSLCRDFPYVIQYKLRSLSQQSVLIILRDTLFDLLQK